MTTSDLAVLGSYRAGVFFPETAKNDLMEIHHTTLLTDIDAWQYMPTSN
jgi:hypothetical protein